MSDLAMRMFPAKRKYYNNLLEYVKASINLYPLYISVQFEWVV